MLLLLVLIKGNIFSDTLMTDVETVKTVKEPLNLGALSLISKIKRLRLTLKSPTIEAQWDYSCKTK